MHHARILAALAALSMLPGQAAQAVTNSVPAGDAPIVNPFNGRATDVWRLVGKTASSAVQITPQWVISSAHSPAGALPQGVSFMTFRNHYGESETLYGTSTCAKAPGYTGQPGSKDFYLCRLKNPENFATPPGFPPLVSAPVLDRRKVTKYGSVLLSGHGGAGHSVAFAGLNSLPFGFTSVADPLFDTPPVGEGNDSGGAVYWVSPTTHEAALMGVITSSNPPALGTGSYLFTAADLQWIVEWITAHGDAPPAIRTAEQHYGGTSADPAPELAAPPTFTFTGSSVTFRWATPSGAPVERYSVGFGPVGAAPPTVSVAAGTGNTVTFNGLGYERYMACVQAINSVGPATPGWMGSTGLRDPNCTVLDTRQAQAPAVQPVSAVRNWLTGRYKMSTKWVADDGPPFVARFRVVRTETAPGVAPKTFTADTTATTASTTVSRGTTVCFTVYGISDLGVLGLPAASQCRVAG